MATYVNATLHHVTLQIANLLINVGRLQFARVIKSKRKSIEIFIVLSIVHRHTAMSTRIEIAEKVRPYSKKSLVQILC